MNLLCKWFGHHWVNGYYSYLWDVKEWWEFDSPICATCHSKKSDIEKGIYNKKYCV